MPREDAIVKKILKFLNDIDGCYAHKVPTTGYTSGQPDIDGCLNGRAIKFEVKQEGRTATPKQAAVLAKWAASGAVSAIVHSQEEAHELLRLEGLL